MRLHVFFLASVFASRTGDLPAGSQPIEPTGSRRGTLPVSRQEVAL